MQSIANFCNIPHYFAMLDLNNPQTRQNALCDRLASGRPLIAAELAGELEISVDTVRRDLIALERKGLLQRVRGGAIPVTPSAPPYSVRAAAPDPKIEPLADQAVPLLPDDGTVFLDAGTTMNSIATRLTEGFRGTIVTPAPSVALAALDRGVRVHLIGGVLCPEGAMATGGSSEREIEAFAADLCILGACGLWPGFGLSAEDTAEAGVKRAMAMASARTMVVTSAAKIGRRGGHRVLCLEEIDALVTDAPETHLAAFRDAGIEIVRV